MSLRFLQRYCINRERRLPRQHARVWVLSFRIPQCPFCAVGVWPSPLPLPPPRAFGFCIFVLGKPEVRCVCAVPKINPIHYLIR